MIAPWVLARRAIDRLRASGEDVAACEGCGRTVHTIEGDLTGWEFHPEVLCPKCVVDAHIAELNA